MDFWRKTLPPRPPLSYSSRLFHYMAVFPGHGGSSANPKIVNRRSFIWGGVLPPLKSGGKGEVINKYRYSLESLKPCPNGFQYDF